MQERDILIGLQEIEGVGWETISKLESNVESLHQLLDKKTLSDLLRMLKINGKRANQLMTFLTEEWIESKLKFYENCNVKIMTTLDADYPAMLNGITSLQKPWVIYARGELSLLSNVCVAVVGMRNCTAYGREAAEWIGYELAARHVSVVSGLARGIDSFAHVGALRAQGPTISILGNGLNVSYPPEHHQLQRRIESNGLVLTQFPWNTRPTKLTFPMRNRLIAGISNATVVVEAAAHSGSLHTADCAIEYGRTVFAVPGPITSAKSDGVNVRIREGAAIVTHPNDILFECGVKSTAEELQQFAKLLELDQNEQELLELIGAEAITIDELLERTQHSFGQLHELLLSLLMKKRIRALSGSAYIAMMK